VTETFVLHLQSSHLAAGEVRGVVEVIATGERAVISTLNELGEVLTARSAREPAAPAQPGPGPRN
jgi:hypothetical protein